jgi:hypothetical protein
METRNVLLVIFNVKHVTDRAQSAFNVEEIESEILVFVQ